MLDMKRGPDGVIRNTTIAEKNLAGAQADLDKILERLRANEIIPPEELHGIVTALADAQRLVAALLGEEA